MQKKRRRKTVFPVSYIQNVKDQCAIANPQWTALKPTKKSPDPL